MKNLKDFILEGFDSIDSILKSLKDKEITKNDLVKSLEKVHANPDIKYDIKNKNISIFYSLDSRETSITCCSINLSEDSTEEKFKIESWDYEDL